MTGYELRVRSERLAGWTNLCLFTTDTSILVTTCSRCDHDNHIVPLQIILESVALILQRQNIDSSPLCSGKCATNTEKSMSSHQET